MPSTRSSRSHNPFDSDEAPRSPVRAYSDAYSNPFVDDDADSMRKGPGRTGNLSNSVASQTRGSKPQNPRHPPMVSDAKNPFDDDHDYGHAPTSSDLQRTPRQGHGRERSRNQFRERVSASGDTAAKKSQRIRDAGANQASKLVEGGIAQTRRMKESTYNAFKSTSNGHGNPRNGSGNLKIGNGKPQGLDELLGHGEGSDRNAARIRYDDSQFQKQDLEYRSVQELEGYAVQKSKDTTSSIQNSLKVAEDIRGDATRTLVSLHEQGEQIRRTHELTLVIDQNLSRGEKLLGSLGGMFSRTWKPKKGRPVTGPAVSRNDSLKTRGHHLQQRAALGLNRRNSKERTNRASLNSNGQQTTRDILEMERAKQDDAVSDLSNVLTELKGMSLDMSKEISRQNVGLNELQTDVTTLNDRVHGANQRARHILRK